jgi:hypothetical protein
MSRVGQDSLAYTLVFAIGYHVACSSNATGHDTTGNRSHVPAKMLSNTTGQDDRGLSE